MHIIPAVRRRQSLRLLSMSLASVALLVSTSCAGSDDSATTVPSGIETTAGLSPDSTSSPESDPATTSSSTTSAVAALLSDQARLVFQRDGVRVSDAAGGSEVAVAPDLPQGEHPDWSPDGASIVFDTDFSAIWRVPSGGGVAERVVSCDAPCVNVYEGAWSPDGSKIAYVMVETADGANTSRSTIQVIDVGSGTARTVFENTAGDVWLYTPRWSPDGASIVFTESTFASTRLDEDEVLGERVAVADLRATAAPIVYVTPVGRSATTPDWSSAGDLIVYASDDNLFTVRPDGTEVKQVTFFDARTEHAIQPSFLPDGKGIVFTYVTGTFGVDDRPRAAVIALDGSSMELLGSNEPVTHPRIDPASA